jgi:hypothetical protein
LLKNWKVENFQLQNFFPTEKFVLANHILQNFLSAEKFPEWKWDFKLARYSYHKNPAQESRTQNRGTIFTRRSRKLINKMKEIPK